MNYATTLIFKSHKFCTLRFNPNFLSFVFWICSLSLEIIKKYYHSCFERFKDRIMFGDSCNIYFDCEKVNNIYKKINLLVNEKE